jgi:hypothetical protein
MTDLFNVSSPGSTHRQSVVAFRSHAGIANSFLVGDWAFSWSKVFLGRHSSSTPVERAGPKMPLRNVEGAGRKK